MRSSSPQSPASQSAWLRVAIEKPFGSDLHSAQEMAAALAPSLTETEIYRVDHYLGKRGVQQIAAFRRHNALALGPLYYSGTISRVEIVMTETESCEYVCGIPGKCRRGEETRPVLLSDI